MAAMDPQVAALGRVTLVLPMVAVEVRVAVPAEEDTTVVPAVDPMAVPVAVPMEAFRNPSTRRQLTVTQE